MATPSGNYTDYEDYNVNASYAYESYDDEGSGDGSDAESETSLRLSRAAR